MSAMENVDFGQLAEDYARHRAGFPYENFVAMFGAGLVAPGARLLDLGTGTGTLTRGFATRGCQVTGLDPSAQLLAQAGRLAGDELLEIRWTEASAEQTGLEAGVFDVDAAAAAEVRRLLIPVGRVIIAHFDWLALPGNMVAATKALTEEHNPVWTMGAAAMAVIRPGMRILKGPGSPILPKRNLILMSPTAIRTDSAAFVPRSVSAARWRRMMLTLSMPPTPPCSRPASSMSRSPFRSISGG